MIPNLSLRTILLSIALLTFITVCAPALCSAQTVTYDWQADKTDSNLPAFRERKKVTIIVTNVNNILFHYDILVSLSRAPYDDWGLIAGLVSRTTQGKEKVDARLAPPPCASLKKATDELAAITKEINTNNLLPVAYAKLPAGQQTSVPLSKTMDEWNNNIAGTLRSLREDARQVISQCTGDKEDSDVKEFKENYRQFETAIARIEANVNSTHTAETIVEVSPGTNGEVRVNEMFGDRPNPIRTATFKFSVERGNLTLSAGALFSMIQDRKYEASKFPGMTQNVLVVQGRSRATPGIVGLLNYSLPGDTDDYGLALAAGPIVRFGNQGDASSFGFFTGLSGHLDRLYFTPGISFTQFADFPVGFSNGSTIPEGFGQLIPVKRWTARFGLAITFGTTNFNNLKSGGTASVDNKPAPAASPPSTSSSPTSSLQTPGGNSNGSIKSNYPNTLAGHTRNNIGNAQDKQVSVSDLYVSSSLAAPTALRTLSLRSDETSDATRVMIDGDAQVKDYTAYYDSGRFYVVIPDAILDVKQALLVGRRFAGIQTERRGNNLVLAFILKPGTRARVQEETNRLSVVFTAPRN